MAQFTKFIEFSGEGVYIRFHPVANVPGYTHRVVILDQKRKLIVSDWLRKDASVTHKCAEYYFTKHQDKIRSWEGPVF